MTRKTIKVEGTTYNLSYRGSVSIYEMQWKGKGKNLKHRFVARDLKEAQGFVNTLKYRHEIEDGRAIMRTLPEYFEDVGEFILKEIKPGKQTKVCTQCGIEYKLRMFNVSSTGMHGVSGECKECKKEGTRIKRNLTKTL